MRKSLPAPSTHSHHKYRSTFGRFSYFWVLCVCGSSGCERGIATRNVPRVKGTISPNDFQTPASEYIDKAFRENRYFQFVRWFIALAFIEFPENSGGKLFSHIAKRQFFIFWLNCNQRQLIPAIRGSSSPRLYTAVLWPTSYRLIYLSTTRSSDFMLIASSFFGRRNLLQLNFHLRQ